MDNKVKPYRLDQLQNIGIHSVATQLDNWDDGVLNISNLPTTYVINPENLGDRKELLPRAVESAVSNLNSPTIAVSCNAGFQRSGENYQILAKAGFDIVEGTGSRGFTHQALINKIKDKKFLSADGIWLNNQWVNCLVIAFDADNEHEVNAMTFLFKYLEQNLDILEGNLVVILINEVE